MLPQNLHKVKLPDEFVILPDFCLHCDAEVSRKIIERDRLNKTKKITFEYFCGTVLTSTNYENVINHEVIIKVGCVNAILKGSYEISKGNLEDHRITRFKQG